MGTWMRGEVAGDVAVAASRLASDAPHRLDDRPALLDTAASPWNAALSTTVASNAATALIVVAEDFGSQTYHRTYRALNMH